MKSSFALKIAGYTLTAVSLIGCGREGASCDLGAKSKESGRTAGQITAVYAALDEFMASAPTNGLRHYFQDHRWTNHIVCVRRRLRKINADIDAVPSLQERIKVLGRYESRILGGIVVRPREFEEVDFYESSRTMLDLLSETLWKATRDDDRVLALWAHQRRVYKAAYERCREEQHASKEEYRRLYPKFLTLQVRLSKVSLSELTEEELAFRDMWDRRYPYLSDRNRVLERLLGFYPHWDVGEVGRRLDGGRLYARFKSLTPEQLKEIEDRVRDRDKE